jgi:hypothetical protein
VALCVSLALARTIAPSPRGLLHGAGRTAPLQRSLLDGISEQNLARWGGALSLSSFSSSSFANFFRAKWVQGSPGPHIRFARFVVPWDLMGDASGEALHFELFAAWLTDVRWLGLTPDLAIAQAEAPIATSAGELPRVPASPAAYSEYVAALLSYASAAGEPIRYVEAWNEPNSSGKGPVNVAHPSATEAAEFTNAASSLCVQHGCTPIAGDFLDSQYQRAGHEEVKEGATGLGVRYEEEYVAHLRPPLPVNWGFHPYAAVKYRTTETIASFERALPIKSLELWFTEVGVYRCEGGTPSSPIAQREGARYLDALVASDFNTAHVFYYELKAPSEAQEALCPGVGGADTSLYSFTGQARPAAQVLFGGAIPTAVAHG